MIISHKHKFVFVRTWKTAGTSIQWNLRKICGPEDTIVDSKQHDNWPYHGKGQKGHAHAQLIANHLQEKWDEYYSFAFVRNPWDTMVSGFWWRSGRMRDIINIDIARKKFARWLRGSSYRDNFAIISVKDKVVVDFVGSFENLERDYKVVADKFGLDQKLPRRKSSYRRLNNHYADYYDDDLRELVTNANRRLIEVFNYEYGR